jgi:predicted transcriptional regulator
MRISELLKALFETKTIAPSYKIPHIFFTIMLIGDSKKGIGRYKIMKKIDLGEGSTKTLLNRLKDENVISVESHRQKGHILTKSGETIFNDLENMISFPKELYNENDKYVVGKVALYIILNRSSIRKDIKLGINQRDEAIKIGGSGATCLSYSHTNKFVFPDDDSPNPTQVIFPIETKRLKKGDLIVIGGAESQSKAILATYAAAISLLQFK